MKRIVALKVLSRAVASTSFIQRFQREVETIAQLAHPNIIMAFDADEADVGHFLVMEFVDGRDLATIVQQNGRFSLVHAVEATLQAARGLEYAHGKNVVHRDIKPANIMLDNSGVIKVADLGLARLGTGHEATEATSLTQAGSIVGTADYMAPEQALDSTTIDHRADIYSLGCTLYFLLTGQAPFQANTVMAVLLRHRDSAIPKLRDIRPDAPVELDNLLSGMLAKQAGSRIAQMTRIVEELAKIQTDVARTDSSLAATGHSITELTVILVEPSRTQAGIVRKYLNELGIVKVHHAGSGKQALELAKQNGGQVFLSSVHLSDMTGMQLATLVRADPSCTQMGFVLTTSGSDAVDVDPLKALPRTALMSKPFDGKKLATAIADATGCVLADRA